MEYAVIGLGQFASSLAIALEEEGNNVLAIDINEDRVRNISNKVTQTAIMDATDEEALKEISINHFDTVIIGMGKMSLEQSLLTALSLVNLGVKNIVAKASSTSHAELLIKIGVDQVVNPESDMGKKLASKLNNKSVLEYIKLSDEIKMESILITKQNTKVVNKTIEQLNLRKKFNINIVCIKREEKVIIVESSTTIEDGDIILVVGNIDYIDTFEAKYGLKGV